MTTSIDLVSELSSIGSSSAEELEVLFHAIRDLSDPASSIHGLASLGMHLASELGNTLDCAGGVHDRSIHAQH